MNFRWLILIVLASPTLCLATPVMQPRAVCGLTDERQPSQDRAVAKLVKKANGKSGCTATLIGNGCMLSAGHCTPVMKVAQFNVRADRSSDPRDVYTVDRKSIRSSNTVIGQDYAVFRVLPNSVTGKLPGAVQFRYPVRFNHVGRGESVRITGFGKSQDANRSFTQQTHNAQISNLVGAILYHDVDTDGGNSGSAIISNRTGEVIGVHTNGGCYAFGGNNSGTSIAGNSKLSLLIQECLASDR